MAVLLLQQKKNTARNGGFLFPEAGGDVFGGAVGHAEELLVGGAGVEAAELLVVAPNLHVVEKAGIARHDVIAGIPRHLQFRILAQVSCEQRDLLGLFVAAHEADAGDLPPVFVQQPVQRLLIQRLPNVVAQVRTMAPHTPVRAVGDIHREGHLIGNLLKDDVVIVVL